MALDYTLELHCCVKINATLGEGFIDNCIENFLVYDYYSRATISSKGWSKMVLFWPIQQELDCINTSGHILGKIKFDGDGDRYTFCPADETVNLSEQERLQIAEKLAKLESGNHTIPMQDDD